MQTSIFFSLLPLSLRIESPSEFAKHSLIIGAAAKGATLIRIWSILANSNKMGKGESGTNCILQIQGYIIEYLIFSGYVSLCKQNFETECKSLGIRAEIDF